jgi:hypothetical protein
LCGEINQEEEGDFARGRRRKGNKKAQESRKMKKSNRGDRVCRNGGERKSGLSATGR